MGRGRNTKKVKNYLRKYFKIQMRIADDRFVSIPRFLSISPMIFAIGVFVDFAM